MSELMKEKDCAKMKLERRSIVELDIFTKMFLWMKGTS